MLTKNRSFTAGELLITLFILAIAVVFVFGHSLQYPFLLWDELSLVLQNPHIDLSWNSIKHVFSSYDPELYIPITMLSYQFNHFLSEFSPAAYHGTNIIIHTLNGLLVYILACHITSKKYIALLAAILFAIHPLHTESVVWIAGRKDLLMTFFSLASINAYLFYEKSSSKALYLVSIVTALLAMLSKVTAVAIPLLLLVLITKNRRRNLIPFFGLSTLMTIVSLGGKTSILSQTDWMQKILISMAQSIFGLSRILVPVRLSPIHPLDEWVSISEPFFLISAITFVGLLLLVIQLRKYRIFYVGFLFFLITFLPSTLNHIREGQILLPYDRYSYMPSIGIIIILAWLLCRIQYIRMFIISIFIIGFSYQAYSYGTLWNDTEKLFTHTTTLYTNNAFAYDKVAAAALTNNHTQKALNASLVANTLSPNNVQYLTNLGVFYGANGDIENEIKTYAYVKKLKSDYLPARYNLAKAYASIGELRLSLQELKTITHLNPNYRDAMELKNHVETAVRKYDQQQVGE